MEYPSQNMNESIPMERIHFVINSIGSTDKVYQSLQVVFKPDDEFPHAPLKAQHMRDVQRRLEETKGLEELILEKCDFTDIGAFQGLIDLVSSSRCSQSSLRLNLSAAKFRNKADFSSLLSALGSNQNIPIFDIDLSNYLCSDYVSSDSSLQNLLQSSSLRSLDLSGHSLGLEAVVEICNGLRGNSTLQELKLHNCCLDGTSASLILESAMVADNLRVIDLGANSNFSATFLNTSIASYLTQTKKLKHLTLDHLGSMFSVDSATAVKPFVQALQSNKTLHTLSLRYCRLCDDVGDAILAALTVNDTLKTLDLEFAGFGLRGKGNEIILRTMPYWKALQNLKVFCIYPLELAPKMLKSLERNSSLHSFSPRFKVHPGASENATDYKQKLQFLLLRNKCLEQGQSFLQNASCKETRPTSAILPIVLARLNRSQDGVGLAASFEVLQHMKYCFFN